LAAHAEKFNFFLKPRIFSNFLGNSYKMEFLPGTPLGFELNLANSEEAVFISKQIRNFFSNLFNLSSFDNYDETISKLRNKILVMRSTMNSHDLLIRKSFDFLLDNVHSLYMPVGWNHGDLSLENIIVIGDDKSLYFLDFLDSPIETPMIDIARILLDLDHGWWGNNLKSTATWETNRLLVIREINLFLADHNIDKKSVDFFSIFAALRVLPYTKSPVRIGYLKTSLSKIMERNNYY
jgi:hypothetical protein